MTGTRRLMVGALLACAAVSGCTTTTRQGSTGSSPPVSSPPRRTTQETAAPGVEARAPASLCPFCGTSYPGEVQYCPVDGEELTPQS